MMTSINFENFVFDHSIQNIKCNECNEFLSVFPIFLSMDQRTLCGRCIEPSSNNRVRNRSFEAIAQFVNFPCRYEKNGCLKKCTPSAMAEHENSCSYRPINCPIQQRTPCNWRGTVSDILSHCRQNHVQAEMNNLEFHINLTQSCDFQKFLEVGSTFYVVGYKFNAADKLCELFICKAEEADNSQTSTCNVRFKTRRRNLTAPCEISTLTEQKVTKILLDPLLSHTENDTIVRCKISFENSQFEEIETVTVDEDLVNAAKCSRCRDCMRSIYLCIPNIPTLAPTRKWIPVTKHTNKTTFSNSGNTFSPLSSGPTSGIFSSGNSMTFSFASGQPSGTASSGTGLSFSTGHINATTSSGSANIFSPASINVAPDLKGDLRCQKCVQNNVDGQAPVWKVRLEQLEKFTTSLNYNCAYAKNGCFYAAKQEALAAHESTCLYSDASCPVNCGWLGVRCDILRHMEMSHGDVFMEMPVEMAQAIDSSALKRYIKCYNRLFQLYFVRKNSCFCWDIKTLYDNESFSYELQVVSLDRNRCFTTRGLCSTKSMENSGAAKNDSNQIIFFTGSDDELTTITIKIKIFKL